MVNAQNSLDLVEGKTDIGMKQIWELYEIWCFLVMKRLIAKVLGLDLQNPNNHVREDKSKMLNTIVKSEMTHVIEFDNVKMEIRSAWSTSTPITDNPRNFRQRQQSSALISS